MAQRRRHKCRRVPRRQPGPPWPGNCRYPRAWKRPVDCEQPGDGGRGCAWGFGPATPGRRPTAEGTRAVWFTPAPYRDRGGAYAPWVRLSALPAHDGQRRCSGRQFRFVHPRSDRRARLRDWRFRHPLSGCQGIGRGHDRGGLPYWHECDPPARHHDWRGECRLRGVDRPTRCSPWNSGGGESGTNYGAANRANIRFGRSGAKCLGSMSSGYR